MNRTQEILALKQRVNDLEKLVGGKHASGIYVPDVDQIEGRYFNLYSVCGALVKATGVEFRRGRPTEIIPVLRRQSEDE